MLDTPLPSWPHILCTLGATIPKDSASSHICNLKTGSGTARKFEAAVLGIQPHLNLNTESGITICTFEAAVLGIQPHLKLNIGSGITI
jgi:hypothetical protein